MRTAFTFAIAAGSMLLAGCGREAGPGGVSAEEERQLDNAASMLDAQDNIAVPEDSLVANEAEIVAEEQANGAANGQ